MAQFAALSLNQFNLDGISASSTITFTPIGIDKNAVRYWQYNTVGGQPLSAMRISMSSGDAIKTRSPMSRLKTRIKVEQPHTTTNNGVETVVSSAFVNVEFNYPLYWTELQRSIVVENLIRLLTNNSPYGPSGSANGATLVTAVKTNQVVEGIITGIAPY